MVSSNVFLKFLREFYEKIEIAEDILIYNKN